MSGVAGQCIKHLFIVLVLVVYSLLGAWMFIALEGEHDLEQQNATYWRDLTFSERRLDVQQQMIKRVHEIVHEAELNSNIDAPAKRARIHKQMMESIGWYEDVLFDYCGRLPDPPEPPKTKWDIWTALYYAGTIYTTIGYGNIAAETTNGRIATMLYAIIGIPITIGVLNQWGHLMFHCACRLWWTVCHCMASLAACLPEALAKKWRALWLPTKELEQEKSKAAGDVEIDSNNVPLILAILALVFWVCLCAGIYSLVEPNWTYFEGFYFFFISFTTIGFGDLTPGDNRFVCLTFVLVMLGLAVVGMSINVVQANIDRAFDDFKKLIEEDYAQRLIADQDANQAEPEIDANATQDDKQLNGDAETGVLGKIKSELPDHTAAFQELTGKQTIGNRIAFFMMGEHTKQELLSKLKKLANRKSTGC